MKPQALLNIEEIPEGKTIHDINPAFAGVDNEFHIGEPSKACAGCRKPFSAIRKPRMEIRLFLPNLPIPIALAYQLCRRCSRKYQHGRNERDAILAAIEAFHRGEEASQ